MNITPDDFEDDDSIETPNLSNLSNELILVLAALQENPKCKEAYKNLFGTTKASKHRYYKYFWDVVVEQLKDKKLLEITRVGKSNHVDRFIVNTSIKKDLPPFSEIDWDKTCKSEKLELENKIKNLEAMNTNIQNQIKNNGNSINNQFILDSSLEKIKLLESRIEDKNELIAALKSQIELLKENN
jgi:hypothetical protein